MQGAHGPAAHPPGPTVSCPGHSLPHSSTTGTPGQPEEATAPHGRTLPPSLCPSQPHLCNMRLDCYSITCGLRCQCWATAPCGSFKQRVCAISVNVPQSGWILTDPAGAGAGGVELIGPSQSRHLGLVTSIEKPGGRGGPPPPLVRVCVLLPASPAANDCLHLFYCT